MDNENSNRAEALKISYAYGLARSEEVEHGDYDATLNLADERMYENKAKSRGLNGK